MTRRMLPVTLLAALSGGIAVGCIRPWPLVPILAAASIAGAVAAYRLFRPDPRSGFYALLGVTLLFGWATSSARLQQPAPAWVARHQGKQVNVSGIIDGTESTIRGGWKRVVLKVDRINGAAVARTRIEVLCKPSPVPLLPGARVSGTGKLQLFQGPSNPGDPDRRLAARIDRLSGVLAAWNTSLHCDSTPGRFHVPAAIQRLRLLLEGVHFQTMPPDYARLLNGIVLGDDQGLDPAWTLIFQRTGTIHILSVSGLHVSLVSLGLFSLLRRLKSPAFLTIILVMLASALYIALSGMQPAGIRAGLMALAGLAGAALGRKTSSARLLAIAALIMLAWDPLLLFDVGFQLSFAATAGVVWVGPALQRGLFRGKLAAAGNAVACSLGAQLAVTPLTAYYFGSITPISLLSNLLMVPLATAALYTGLFAAISGLVWLPLAQWVNRGTALILWALLQSGRSLSQIPAACVPVPAPGFLFLASFYACLAGLTVAMAWEGSAGRERWRPITAALLAAALSYAGWSALRFVSHTERVTVLDVGQGNAALLELDGRWGVIDAGPPAPQGIGPAGDYLRRRGVRHLSFVILTHAHEDHYGGLAAVLSGRKTDRLIVPRGIASSPEFGAIRSIAAANRVPIVQAGPSMGLRIGAATLCFIWPPGEFGAGGNEGSLVIMLETPRGRVLFPGDAGEAELETILRKYGGRLKCDVLLAAHHGSRNSLSAGFYGGTRPELAVISVGPNRYGHPSPEVVQALRLSGCQVWQTQDEGAVIFTAGPDGVKPVAWKKRGLFGMWLWKAP